MDNLYPKIWKSVFQSQPFPWQWFSTSPWKRDPCHLHGRLPRWHQSIRKGRKRAGNYRPVSLTSVPCKIIKSILKDRIVNYLVKKYLLSVHHHGFTCGESCLTNLLETFEQWTRALDKRQGVDVVYLATGRCLTLYPKQTSNRWQKYQYEMHWQMQYVMHTWINTKKLMILVILLILYHFLCWKFIPYPCSRILWCIPDLMITRYRFHKGEITQSKHL